MIDEAEAWEEQMLKDEKIYKEVYKRNFEGKDLYCTCSRDYLILKIDQMNAALFNILEELNRPDYGQDVRLNVVYREAYDAMYNDPVPKIQRAHEQALLKIFDNTER